MQFLRRLTLIDFALFLALIVAGVLAIANQRSAVLDMAGGTVVRGLSDATINAFGAAAERLFVALADGTADVPPAFAAVEETARSAGDEAFADGVRALAFAHAAADAAGRQAALAQLNGLIGRSPFATSFLNIYAGGTLTYALNSGPEQPAPGREWVHLVWIETTADLFVGWDIATGEAAWSVEPGNAAVTMSLSIPGNGYSGALRLAPAGPGALMEVSANFNVPLAESVIALGDPVPTDEGVLVLDIGVAAGARPGMPWSGETRLGEPPELLRNLRMVQSLAWTGTVADGRTFIIRIMVGDTGRAAIAAVFPA